MSITKLRNIGQGLGVRNTHSIPSQDLLIDDIMVCSKKIVNCDKECIIKENYQDNLVIGDPCDFDLSDEVGSNIPELLDISPVQVNKLVETKTRPEMDSVDVSVFLQLIIPCIRISTDVLNLEIISFIIIMV